MKNENHETHEMQTEKKTDYEFTIQIVIITVLAMLLVYNGIKIFGNENASTGLATGIGTVSASEIIPTGTPAIYGDELKIKYDYVTPNDAQLTQATINKLASYEDEKLTASQMERYKKIGGSISCEYCCGAESLIFSNGERACGCAHSYAMRGLAKYLLIKHPDMTDLEILSELGKWKVLFFPGVHEQKAKVLESKGIDSKDYVNLASNKYRGIEQGQSAGGNIVGGC